jgi:hypothetical protein
MGLIKTPQWLKDAGNFVASPVQDIGKDIEKRTHKVGRSISSNAQRIGGAVEGAARTIGKNVQKSGQEMIQDTMVSLKNGDWSRTLLDATLKSNPYTALVYNSLSPEERDKVRGNSTTERFMITQEAKATSDAVNAGIAQQAMITQEEQRSRQEQMKAMTDTINKIAGGRTGGMRQQALGVGYTLFGGPPTQTNSLLTRMV